MSPSIYGTLRSLINEGHEPEAATDLILKGTTAAELRQLIRPLLLLHARHALRAVTRRVEDETFKRIEGGEDPMSARRKLVGYSFDLPGGRTVHWLDATATEHMERAFMQRALADKCIVDAERHEQAAAEIEAAGVSCLRELEEAEAVA